MCRRFESAPRHHPFLTHRHRSLSAEIGHRLGAEGGSRTHTGSSPKVFETFASTIPPLRHVDTLILNVPIAIERSRRGLTNSPLDNGY